jgi:nickel superoxide dismutase
MIRMIDLLNELNTNDTLTFEQQATFNRLVGEKEIHGKKVKEEVSILWGDYFKQPQLDKYPELHTIAHEIMLLTSFTKQHIRREETLLLLDKVNQFSEMF